MMQMTPFGRLEIAIDDLPVIGKPTAGGFPRTLKEAARPRRETPSGDPGGRRVEEDGPEAVPGPASPPPLEPAPRSRASKGGEKAGNPTLPAESLPTDEKASPPLSPGEVPPKGSEGSGSRLRAPASEIPPERPGSIRSTPLPGLQPPLDSPPGAGAKVAAPSVSAAPQVRTAAPAASTGISQAPRRSPSAAPRAAPPPPPARSRGLEHPSLQEHRDSIIRRIALALSREGGEMHLLLDPPALGRLSLQLQLEGRRLRLRIGAEKRSVADLLRTSTEDLSRMLRIQGLEIADLEISTQDRKTGNEEARDFERRHPGSRLDASNGTRRADLLPPREKIRFVAFSDSGIDLIV